MSEINGNKKNIFNSVIISDKIFGTKQLTHEVWFYIIMRLESITENGLYQGTVFSMILGNESKLCRIVHCHREKYHHHHQCHNDTTFKISIFDFTAVVKHFNK